MTAVVELIAARASPAASPQVTSDAGGSGPHRSQISVVVASRGGSTGSTPASGDAEATAGPAEPSTEDGEPDAIDAVEGRDGDDGPAETVAPDEVGRAAVPHPVSTSATPRAARLGARLWEIGIRSSARPDHLPRPGIRSSSR